MQRAERAVSVVVGLAAAGVAVVAGAPLTAALGALALYAGIGYYASRHPDVIRGGRRETGPDWVAGGFAGGLSFGLLGLVAVDTAPWILVLAVGFAGFGFVAGVSWARADDGDEAPR